MTLSSPPSRWVGVDIDTAISSLITCLFTVLFCTGECHFILRFQSGFRLCEYSTDCSRSLVCLPYPPILSTLRTTHLLQPHPTQPFPWPPQRCCPVLQSQASGLSVCVSEVALLYGELMWQSRGRPTCMWQRLQLSSPSLTSWVFSLPTDPNFVHCGSDLWGVFSLWRPSRHLTQKLESWCTFHTPGHHLCYVFHTKSYEWWSEKNLHAG